MPGRAATCAHTSSSRRHPGTALPTSRTQPLESDPPAGAGPGRAGPAPQRCPALPLPPQARWQPEAARACWCTPRAGSHPPPQTRHPESKRQQPAHTGAPAGARPARARPAPGRRAGARACRRCPHRTGRPRSASRGRFDAGGRVCESGINGHAAPVAHDLRWVGAQLGRTEWVGGGGCVRAVHARSSRHLPPATGRPPIRPALRQRAQPSQSAAPWRRRR